MRKLYTDLKNIPASFIPKIVDYNRNFVFTPSIENCDFVLLPFWEVLYEYSDSQYRGHNLDPLVRNTVVKSVESLIERAEQHNKKLVIFNWSDDEKPIPVLNSLLFRTSLYKSKQKENEFAFPSWHGDLTKDYNKGVLEVRKKSSKPGIGFRGSSRPLGVTLFDLYRYNLNFINRMLNSMELSLVPKHQWNAGQILRKEAMVALMKNKNIRTDFKVITRGFINQKNLKKRQHNRYKFVENIFNNDYILCVRGAGNYSFRFYETISAGRIPVFINTDCVLPYDFEIDWKKYCVWVEESDVNKIDQILLDFHNDLTDDDFEELQIRIREIWNLRLSPKAFFENIESHFQQVFNMENVRLK